MIKLTYKLFTPLICLLLLFPIMRENISSFIFILLCLNTVIYKILLKDNKFFEAKTLLLTIPFWILFITSLFSSNYKVSLLHVNHGLLFLMIPIIFSLIPSEFFVLKKLNLYFLVLKNVCLLITIIYVISFLINIPFWRFNFMDGYVFREYIYNYFKFFVIHPSYYTAILILVSAHSFDLVLKEKQYWQLIYVFSFLIITFLLLTKLNMILMVITLVFMVLFRSYLKLKQKLLLSFCSLSFIVLLVMFIPGIKNRFSETYYSFNSKPEALAYDSTNIRKAIYDCSIQISKENLVIGVGFENLQLSLNDCYKSNYDSSFYQNHNYMTHNYYLYILLSAGIIGFMFYLIYLINLIKICIKSNLFLFRVLIINALIICFIEDYFYRQFGLLYFSLMAMIFIKHYEARIIYKSKN